MKIIERKTYLEKIHRNFGKDQIIILTGQRRVGKSYLLRSLRDLFIHKDDANVIFIDKEKREYDPILTYKELNQHIEKGRKAGVMNYVLIDEVQDIEGFERSLRAFYEEEDIEIVVTGSNSNMLSGELSTIIGGRYKEIYVQSLTYEEFLVFHKLEDSDESLAKFLRYGGLPGLARVGLNDDDVLEYQHDILSTVLLKDIILRQSLRNIPFMQNLLHYIADNTGKLISASNIVKYMKSNQNPVSVGTVLDYLSYLGEAFVTRKVSRYDLHGKRLFESNDKYYFQDIGIRNSLIRGVRAFDIEKVMENAVYNHLISMGYEVAVGQLRNNKEIDFVATKPGGKVVYIQVTYLIASEETYQREFGNLLEIKDNYPKYVVSMSPLIGEGQDGINHISLREFLKRKMLE